MVYRIYVEKKEKFAREAVSLAEDLRSLFGIGGLEKIRIIGRYDVEGIDEGLFNGSIDTVFSEPQVDDVFNTLPDDGAVTIAVEFLPGQFDQRAESAAECIQLISKGDRPLVRYAKVYLIYGDLKQEDLSTIKNHLINPVESREASLAEFNTISTEYDIPESVETLVGFKDLDEKGIEEFMKTRDLAMDPADLSFCRDYFKSLDRDPTITEIKVIDTYWSDHCRHTTFNTTLDNIQFEDPRIQKTYEEYLDARTSIGRTKPVSLMDIGTLAAKMLKKRGLLDKLDESEEINACTVKIDVDVDGKTEKWLLLFKNETHNHPTEIEPFGGAATCIGGAIRDPLSGRSYVYAAMRVTGAADPLTPVEDTLEGKLPQRKIVTSAADGYSSYGNQIGLPTGQVEEIYHPGYVAKRMEVGAVIAAAPEENVIRMRPEPGDAVILLGGKTGRDGCGGATGSSKKHTTQSLETCGAEVQKGNAPEERKLQRLFRDPKASRMIKRCNDFGAGGVSVAIGELADGLSVDLDKVPKKYEGLDGTELAISESQERMAVVVAGKDVEAFLELAARENLQATKVADVIEEPYLREYWRGELIVDISREFLDTNGTEKHMDARVGKAGSFSKEVPKDFCSGMKEMAGDLNCCSGRGLAEKFDSTVGAGAVLMPFGGRFQRTPTQAMVYQIPVNEGETETCSLMSYGFDPYISEASPYDGAYLAVVESVSKLVAQGASFKEVYLSFQEYFQRLGTEAVRWGQPLAAVLGAYKAQMDLGVAAIGGKDSMSGSFEDIDVPPTLISFAVTTDKVSKIVSQEFKSVDSKIIMLTPEYDEHKIPGRDSLLKIFEIVDDLNDKGQILACYTPGSGGVAEGLMKMCLGNGIGVKISDSVSPEDLFDHRYGSFVLEVPSDTVLDQECCRTLGATVSKASILYSGNEVSLEELSSIYENKLEDVYRCNIEPEPQSTEEITFRGEAVPSSAIKVSRPRVLIPVFPGTNCEYESEKAFRLAGADTDVFVIKNLTSAEVAASVSQFADRIKESQIVFIPGGFSGGDEPDGSGKFITAFFRNPEIKEAVEDLLSNRDGLMAGICNGFQALIKLGLLPYGTIRDMDENCPTLTFNEIGRHQSKIVRVRVASDKSPWMKGVKAGDIFSVPISHGEGRFVANEDVIRELAHNGQILTQYVDLDGKVSNDIQYNPNGSYHCIEGITSPDGRVIGKMGHAERIGPNLYKNVPGEYDMKLFESAVEYFK